MSSLSGKGTNKSLRNSEDYGNARNIIIAEAGAIVLIVKPHNRITMFRYDCLTFKLSALVKIDSSEALHSDFVSTR